MLDSFWVQNFRLFQELKIPRLARLNLLVGNNNSGKSSLLEALFLFHCQAHPASLFRLLAGRESLPMEVGEEIDPETNPLLSYFPAHNATAQSIQLGSLTEEQNRIRLGVTESEPTSLPGLEFLSAKIFSVTGNCKERSIPLEINPAMVKWGNPHQNGAGWLSTGKNIDPETLNKWWDHVNVHPEKRHRVFQMLRLIDPELKEVVFVNQGSRPRPVAIFENGSFPLSSQGDGMVHLLHMALALENAAGGILCIDEFENGLHYSVQQAIWNLIFQVAEQMDIQVFASTHSRDCIQTFQEAARLKDSSCMLIHLGRSILTSTYNQIVATAYDRDELLLADHADLEVR